MSEQTPETELYKAIATVQGAWADPERTRKGHNNKYADLSDILGPLRPMLSEAGLILTQPTIRDESNLVVKTIIQHVNGASIECEYPACGISGNHQQMGAAITYARRYSLSTLMGISSTDDTDGEGAAPVGDPRPKKMSSHQGKKELDYPAMQADVDASNAAKLVKWDQRLKEMKDIWPTSFISSLYERVRDRRLELADEQLQGADMHSLSAVYENIEASFDGLVPSDDLERLYEQHQARLTGVDA